MIDARTALKELANEVKLEIERRISAYGMNPRVGVNTLKGSELEKSISIEPTTGDTLVFQIADYFEFIVRGWKRTGRYPGTMGKFVENLTDWVRRKGIRFEGKTENQVVWAILKSIWMRGIAPRPFLNWDENGDPSVIMPFLDDYFDKWSDLVWNQIIEEIDKRF